MIRVSSRIEVRTPATIVFGYLSDPRNQREWTPNFQELERAPSPPLGLGTRYRGRLRVFGWVNFVIDEFEAGRSFRVDTDPPVGRLTHRFTVDRHGAGSRVAHVVELEPRGAARFGAPVLHALIKLMVLDLNRHMTKVLNTLTKEHAMPTDTPAVVARYFEQDADGNIDAVVALFTEDAVVVDEGQTRHGTSEIRDWRNGAASKYEYTTTITAGQPTGPDTYRMTARLDGDFPGNTVDLNFDFTIDADRISHLKVAP